MSEGLELFGRLFMKEVRDRSIRIFDKKIQGLMKDESSILFSERVNKLNPDERSLIYEMIPEVVDLCMHNMLVLFDESDEYRILSDDGDLGMLSDGLAGELYSPDGWIARFSEQRFSCR